MSTTCMTKASPAALADCFDIQEDRWSLSDTAQSLTTQPSRGLLREENGVSVFNAILDAPGRGVPRNRTQKPSRSAEIRECPSSDSYATDAIDPCDFVASLSRGVNLALPDALRHLEQFPPADPTIGHLLRARGAASAMPKHPARLYLRFLDLAILTWAAIHAPVRDQGSRRTNQPLATWRLKLVRDYVDKHLGEPIRLADLAKAVGLSRMHFAAQFRAREGMSPHEYLMTRRIQRAQRLLRDTGATIVDVALRVGFQTQAHFTTVFRRCTGYTPYRWRVAGCVEEGPVSQTRPKDVPL
jgi:AraC-like DNA-binding protein